MTTSATPFVLMDGLYGDIKNPANHYTCDVDAFNTPSNAFEVLMEGTPCRLFIDVDGEMSADTDEATFNKVVAECEQKFCACESIIGVRNSSHFKALKFDMKTENGRKTRIRKIVKKISFTLLYNKVFPTCGMIKDYAVAETLPQLQALLGDTIEITTENKENTLNLDTSVYRTNGKVRAPNAYKYEEQPERVSKIVKGSILDNLIQHIPEGCPSAPEVASRATTPKTPRVASVSVEPPAVHSSASASVENSGDTELARTLLQGLAQKRFANYDDWLKMLLVVVQERWDYKMFDEVCAARAEGTSYNKASNQAKYASIKIRKEGGLTQATLWNWLKQDNKALFDALQKQRRDFYKQLDEGLSDIEYAKMFYSVRPDRYFYSDQTEWWEIRENNKYYNTGKRIPIGITNVISECLREMLEDQRKNLNPLDEKTKDRSAALLKEYRRLGDRKPLENIASFLPKLCMVEKEDLDFKMDANTNLIAFKDCVYDLRTNTYRAIVPSDFISKTTGYNMGDRKSDTTQRKKVLAIIESVFPDKDLRDYWLKCSALSFFTNRFQMLYILTGTGGNGKGVLTSFIKAAGGDYVYGADQTFLTSVQKSGQANSCLASCDGVRIVLVSEPDNGEKNCYMNTEFMKSITGGDPINARMLFQNAKVFTPRFTVLMSCNNKPEIRKLDRAILRRLSIHPFLCSFKSNPDKANPYEKLGDSTITDLKDDAAFVREFMMFMIETAHANKDVKSIEMPEASKEAVEDYVSDNNHFKVWFEAHYKKEVEIKTTDKAELAEWRKERTHSTGDIYKKFTAATGSRMSSSQFLGAINYNELQIHKQGGQKWLRYYEYSEVAEDVEYDEESD
jgi:P4 family phage/plasmid primase-like protien